MSILPALGKLRQKNQELKANPSYIVRARLAWVTD